MTDLLAETRRHRLAGLGKRRIAPLLGISASAAHRLIQKVDTEIALEKARALTPRAAADPAFFYDAACRALAEAKSLSEVKTIADKAVAMQEYYRRANNRALEIDAAEIRIIAMREWGIMYGEEKAQGRVPKGGNPNLSQPVQPPHRLPTLAELKIDGHFSANAQKLAALPDETIADRLDAWREQATTDRRVTVNILKDADKREQRAKREAHLGTMQAEANLKLPEKRYGVIYADPPWAFEVYSEKGMDRAPENHYPTMGLYDIKLLHVNDLAHSDCVLFMWATVPMLEAALAVMECWRFVYKSHFIWRKDKVGLGYWNRNVHELVLIGTRGNVPAPEPGTRELTVFDAPVGAHSEKPELFAQYIENWYPTLPKIELFARKARNGWDRWGLDAPAQEGSYILDKHA